MPAASPSGRVFVRPPRGGGNDTGRNLFAETGEVTSDATAAFLVGYLDAFGELVDRYARVAVAA